MWWLIHDVEEKIRRRKTQRKCVRCGLLYLKVSVECPRCTGVNDHNLNILLGKRTKFTVGLGKIMFLAAVIIVLLLFVINQ